LDTFVQLVLQFFNPSLSLHAWLDLDHVGRVVSVAARLETFLHRGLELIADLRIFITVKDAPRLQLGLSEHLALDLAVDLSRVFLNVERDRCTTGAWTHHEIACFVFEPAQLLRILIELEVPKLLLLDTFRIGLEMGHQVLDLLDLGFRVGVHNLGKVLHQVEVRAHCISQAGQLAELGNKGDLVTRSPVLVDQKWLIQVFDGLIVPSLVVVCVARRSPVLVETSGRTLSKVYSVDLVGLLVVAGHDSHTTDCLLDRLLAVLASRFGVLAQVI